MAWLGDILAHTICEHMRDESHYLQQHAHQTRAAIKEIIETANIQADRVIRSVEANQGKPSNALTKEIQTSTKPGLWEAIAEAIDVAFHGNEYRSS